MTSGLRSCYSGAASSIGQASAQYCRLAAEASHDNRREAGGGSGGYTGDVLVRWELRRICCGGFEAVMDGRSSS